MLALRSPELDVNAITTVSGNVHVNHVVPNVFKVMDILELKDRPLVTRGADCPIKKDPMGVNQHCCRNQAAIKLSVR